MGKTTGIYTINPDESKTIEANCCIFALGQPQQIENLQKFILKIYTKHS